MKIYQDLELRILLFVAEDAIRTSGEMTVEETDDTAPDFEW